MFAGLVAIAVTVAVERLGGVIGGMLGTLPSTIIPATAGIWAESADAEAFGWAMASVPAGMLASALFLWVWRVLPPRLPAWSLHLRLAVMSVVSLSWWALWAGAATSGLDLVRGMGLSQLVVGWGVWAGAAAIGVWACLNQPGTRGQSRPVAPLVLVARGVFAGGAIAVAVWLASLGSPVLSGIASVFPAIFLTTMVSLWLSQGDAVPASAVGPMMLGSTAVSGYALVAAWTVPALGVGLGSAVAWLVAALGITWPATTWLRRRQRAAVS